VKAIFALAALVASAATLFGQQPSAAARASPAASLAAIHPAVARIVAPGDGSVSYGSGTLVHVTDQAGLVITNWHVVNEATGPISVHFPDGFYSLGRVEQVDRDWDLAIISIRKPNAQPVSLANEAPRPGDVLTIAGYGSGQYRAASGRCTQYVAPGTKFPFEMVEVAVSARQGDSGGPIFNEKGELAGVLFGEGHGRTSGSYCGRVRWFLTSVLHTQPAAVLAEAPLRQLPARTAEPDPLAPATVALAPSFKQAAASMPRDVSASPPEPPTASVSAVVDPTQQDQIAHLGWEDIAGHTLGEQIKSVLAGVGVIAVILQVLHFASRETAKR
jgi:hypothetical protein